MADCAEFIDAVLAAADQMCAASLRERVRRKALAVWLVGEFVPPMRLGGRDLRHWIVPRAHFAVPLECWTVRGFRPDLVAGGQGVEVFRHLAAAAAAVLMRRRVLVWAASLIDRAQGLLGRHRQESRAELAGNRAGVQLGLVLCRYLADGLTRDSAAQKLRTLLSEAPAGGNRAAELSAAHDR